MLEGYLDEFTRHQCLASHFEGPRTSFFYLKWHQCLLLIYFCLVSNFNRNSFNVPPFTIILVADFGSIYDI